MYLYLKTFYEQWCNGQDQLEIARRSKDFIELVHATFGYPSEVVEEFLRKQPWFKELL